MLVPILILAAQSCRHHLIADDPYQYEAYSVDQLVDVWLAFERVPEPIPATLLAEVVRRLAVAKYELSPEDTVILQALIQRLPKDYAARNS